MREFYFWLGWNCEKFEQHLEEMAQNGWRLKSASFGITILEYERREPSKVSYCLDYNPKYTEDSLSIIRDDQWYAVSKSVGWWLWEKEYETEKPKLFTDKSSLIERDKRLLFILLLLFCTQLPLLITTLSNNYKYNFHRFDFSMISLSIIYSIFILFYIYALTKLYLRIRKYNR
ncbi:DUF2812 domain-containing protein [Fusibacter bizertensis]|uniref:DUF2812 domain-containing protein n=1 Tax=Fusibacter bizertensis TaxID=1488331 RepID=A0ABT6NEK8_9FIRM|nr:DUF2812 domain-containing protein [Fusibacter bizertensis]MDH8678827.1 DUF2812 domain-containing protein [Fusibacter bizertensis]